MSLLRSGGSVIDQNAYYTIQGQSALTRPTLLTPVFLNGAAPPKENTNERVSTWYVYNTSEHMRLRLLRLVARVAPIHRSGNMFVPVIRRTPVR